MRVTQGNPRTKQVQTNRARVEAQSLTDPGQRLALLVTAAHFEHLFR